jgi:outer membrane protein assembly factor BamC
MANTLRLFLLAYISLLLPGCSYLESYFPDKERDYQYTTEIPMLDWPAELRKNQLGATNEPSASKDAPGSASASEESFLPKDYTFGGKEPAASQANEQPPESQSESVTPAEVRVSESDDRNIVSSVEIVKYDDGESRLRLGAGFAKAWRVVSKSITRNSIEVTGRNHEQGLITVQYDPDEKRVKDDSFMDEIYFIFQGIGANDETYLLKLEEHDQMTDVIVLNEEHLPMLNSEPALRLLKLMADTIKADTANKAKAEKEKAEQEQAE